MRFILPPGTGRWSAKSRSEIITYLGLSRHDWGSIHAWVSYLFIILLTVHIILHWKWIISTTQSIINNSKNSFRKNLKSLMMIIFILSIAFIWILPFMFSAGTSKVKQTLKKVPIETNDTNEGGL
jgi:hypothetical protein